MTRGQEQSIEQRLEERVYLSMLYDFYGALLKENNRRIFEAYIQEDYSISEIAEEMEISRQAVHDAVKRITAGDEYFGGGSKGAGNISDPFQDH